MFPDIHDHLGEVQPLWTARSGTGPRGIPGNDFLEMLKQKLLGMIKTKKPFLGTAFVNALLLAVRGAGPHPDGHGYLETTENYCFHHPP